MREMDEQRRLKEREWGRWKQTGWMQGEENDSTEKLQEWEAWTLAWG